MLHTQGLGEREGYGNKLAYGENVENFYHLIEVYRNRQEHTFLFYFFVFLNDLISIMNNLVKRIEV